MIASQARECCLEQGGCLSTLSGVFSASLCEQLIMFLWKHLDGVSSSASWAGKASAIEGHRCRVSCSLMFRSQTKLVLFLSSRSPWELLVLAWSALSNIEGMSECLSCLFVFQMCQGSLESSRCLLLVAFPGCLHLPAQPGGAQEI